MTDMSMKTDNDWKSKLTPEQYRVTRKGGTEPPHSGILLHNPHKGIYSCVCCGNNLFDSHDKFDSGSGWPSFTNPLAQENIHQREDTSHGMIRTEVQCSRCGAHLGHVFDDGPGPGKKRYCINSIAMNFEKAD